MDEIMINEEVVLTEEIEQEQIDTEQNEFVPDELSQEEPIAVEERELTEEELHQKKIRDEFERLKNLPHTENVLTEEQIQAEIELENKNKRVAEIKSRLEQLSQDLIQAQAGAVFDDLEERKTEFQTLHNELRTLLGKEPRIYN